MRACTSLVVCCYVYITCPRILVRQGAARGTDVRPAVVRPRRPIWLGNLPERSGIHIRAGYFGSVQPHKRFDACVEGTSAGYGCKWHAWIRALRQFSKTVDWLTCVPGMELKHSIAALLCRRGTAVVVVHASSCNQSSVHSVRICF